MERKGLIKQSVVVGTLEHKINISASLSSVETLRLSSRSEYVRRFSQPFVMLVFMVIMVSKDLERLDTCWKNWSTTFTWLLPAWNTFPQHDFQDERSLYYSVSMIISTLLECPPIHSLFITGLAWFLLVISIVLCMEIELIYSYSLCLNCMCLRSNFHFYLCCAMRRAEERVCVRRRRNLLGCWAEPREYFSVLNTLVFGYRSLPVPPNKSHTCLKQRGTDVEEGNINIDSTHNVKLCL